ncbi:MAG: hypothetical protein PVI30_21890 [Myxococcales bacterium]|jgi:hypothetical protein
MVIRGGCAVGARALGLWLAPCLLLCMWAASAAAQPSVAMLGLVSEDGDDGLAAELSDAVYSEVGSVQEWNLSASRPSVLQMTMVNDCDIQAEMCRAKIGTNLGVEQVIYGKLRRVSQDTVAVELSMFDSAGGTIIASAQGELWLGDRSRVPDLAAALVADLHGAPTAAAPAAIPPAPPPAPSALPGPDPAPAQATTAREQPSEEPYRDYSQAGVGRSNDWVGFALLGVSGASLGLTVFSWIQIDAAANDPDYLAYQRAVGRNSPTVQDVCEEAERGEDFGDSSLDLSRVKDLCSQGATFEVLQFVFLGTAVASGALALVFLLDDDGEQAAAPGPSLALEPHLGPDSGFLNARLRF